MLSGLLFDGKIWHEANISLTKSRVKLKIVGNTHSPTCTSTSTHKCSKHTLTVGNSIPTWPICSLMRSNNFLLSCSLLARTLFKSCWHCPRSFKSCSSVAQFDYFPLYNMWIVRSFHIFNPFANQFIMLVVKVVFIS
jgi:hypothetical protein